LPRPQPPRHRGQPIKEGKNAATWTRLSCRRFAGNAVRPQLQALACNLANFLRPLALPGEWLRVRCRASCFRKSSPPSRHFGRCRRFDAEGRCHPWAIRLSRAALPELNASDTVLVPNAAAA
jgi:hypothetical protein